MLSLHLFWSLSVSSGLSKGWCFKIGKMHSLCRHSSTARSVIHFVVLWAFLRFGKLFLDLFVDLLLGPVMLCTSLGPSQVEKFPICKIEPIKIEN